MSAATWTPAKYDLIREHYPLGGAVRVQAYMPEHSIGAITQRACRLGVRAPSKHSHPLDRKESPVPLPAPHDYTDADRAWMAAGDRHSKFYVPAPARDAGGGFGPLRVAL